MELNHLAHALISFLPLIIAYFYFQPKYRLKYAGESVEPSKLRWWHYLLFYPISALFVFGLMNLTIHQIGFYELFFTDIMKGNAESKIVVEQFLSEYGEKHRYFSHGFFHGLINSVTLSVPFVGLMSIVNGRSFRSFLYHTLYWLITITLVCALVAEFV